MAGPAILSIRILGDASSAERAAKRANDAFGGMSRMLGNVLLAAGPIAPALAAVAAAAGGLAAAAAAAGAGAGAFAAAVGPQFAQIGESTELYAKAQEAAAEGGKKAAEAQKAYVDSLGKMTPATRETATAFIGLKEQFKGWSDSLSGATMPIFTRAIEGLKGALPGLTPFVTAAAGAFNTFLDKVGEWTSSGAFKGFITDLQGASGGALSGFLNSILNLAAGFSGILRAFLPMSTSMTGGLESMTAKFRAWGESLKGSAGFESFMASARQGGESLKNFAIVVGRIVVGLAPLIGALGTVSGGFLKLLAAIPPDVLANIGAVIGTIAVAVRVWAIAQAILNVALSANPIGIVVIAIAALVALIVVAWQRNEQFRTIVIAAWNAIKTNAQVVWAFVGQIIRVTWNAIQSAAGTVWNGIKNTITSVFNAIRVATNIWNTIKSTITGIWDDVRSKVTSSVSAIRTTMAAGWAIVRAAAETAWNGVRDGIIKPIASALTTIAGIPGKAKSALSGAGSALYEAGKNLIQGMINGAKALVGSLLSTIRGIASSAIDAAKGALGISSPSLEFTKIGKQTIQGFLEGLKSAGKEPGIALEKLLTGSLADIQAIVSKTVSTVRSAYKGLKSSADDALIASLGAANTKLKDLARQRDAIIAQMEKAREYMGQVTESMAGYAYQQLGDSTDPQGLKDVLAARLATLQQFGQNVVTLSQRNLNKDLLKQIIATGAESGAALTQALANASVQEINDLNAVATGIADASKAIGVSSADAMFDAGKQAGQGFLTGLQAEQAGIIAQMSKIAKALVKAIKKALKIKSPSQVMAGLGVMTGRGFADGLRSTLSDVEKVFARMGMTPNGGFQSPVLNGSITLSPDVHVYMDGTPIRAAVRTELRKEGSRYLAGGYA